MHCTSLFLSNEFKMMVNTYSLAGVPWFILIIVLILIFLLWYLYSKRVRHLGEVLKQLSLGDSAARAESGLMNSIARAINLLGERLKKEQQNWEQTRKNYRQLVENGQDVIFTVSADGKVTSLSLGIEAILGYTEEDWVGKSFKTAIHPDDLDIFLHYYEAILEGQHPRLFGSRVKDKSGEYHHLEYTFTPQLERGDIVGVIGIARDVTERIRAEEELRESREILRKTLDSLAEAVFILEPGTRIIRDCNRAAEQIFGYRREEMINRNTEILHIDKTKYEVFDDISVPKLIKQGVFHNEFELKRKDGSTFFSDHTVSLVYDENGDIDLIVSVIRDITERKRAREQLEESQRQLRHLARHLQTVQEAERKRISQDIHDELGQILTTIQLDVSWIQKNLPEKQSDIARKIRSMLDEVEKANDTVQQVTMQLRPKMLDDLGFDAAVEWEIQKLEEHSEIECELRLEMDGVELDKDASIILYRILQEALN